MFRRTKSFWAVFLGVMVALAMASGDADAKRKKKRKAKKKEPPKVDTRAIGELMGGFEWGMSPKQVQKILSDRIDEKYKEQIAEKASDVYEQDRLRAKAKKEKKKLKKSFVKFKGQRTGWDVSIIDEEFAHKNDESMLVFWEQDPEKKVNQRRFFFFVDDQLYKMYIAFDAQMFPEGKRKFVYFHEIMEKRYGPGELVFEDDKYGGQNIKHVHWKDDSYYLRAVNRLSFYGTFCLALSDSKVERWLSDRRAERNPMANKGNAVIDSVLEDENDSTSLDESNSNAVDHLLRD